MDWARSEHSQIPTRWPTTERQQIRVPYRRQTGRPPTGTGIDFIDGIPPRTVACQHLNSEGVMKTVQQIILTKVSGDGVIVCEIDFCQTGPERFLVNFRQGLEGTVLQEGSETPLSVSRDEARHVYESLIAKRRAQGFQLPDEKTVEASQALKSSAHAESPSKPDPRHDRLLQRLAEGTDGPANWPLSRVAWHCGEHRLTEAENLLVSLIGTGDSMLDYCIVWALGQMGSETSVPFLKQLEAEHDAPAVRRIAAVALLEVLPSDELANEVEKCVQQLPEELRTSARVGPAEDFCRAIERTVNAGRGDSEWLPEIVYLIDNEHTRPALLQWLSQTEFRPGTFHKVRHIFKAAELRRDSEVFAILALRFERTRDNFRMEPRYVYQHRTLPTEGKNPDQVYSVQTRAYLQRRCWRTLKRLVNAGQNRDYVRMAAAILLNYTDDDGLDPFEHMSYVFDRQRRRYDYVTTHYDRFRFSNLLNRILYSNSSRYRPAKKGRWQCVPPWQPGHHAPDEREEAWPELWDEHPDVVLKLLTASSCQPVHEFGVRVLVDNREFCEQLTPKDIVALLNVQYDVTLLFALVHAVRLYDSEHPDTDLLCVMADCHLPQVRQQAYNWLSADESLLLQNTELVVRLVCSRQKQTREMIRERLRSSSLSEQVTQVLVGRIVSSLILMQGHQQETAAAITETLQIVFADSLRRLGRAVIRDLAAHCLPAVQRLAAELILNHDSLATAPPLDVVRSLLDSEDESVRGSASRISGRVAGWQPESVDFLFFMTRHQYVDVRAGSETLLSRFAQESPQDADELTLKLVQALLIAGAPDGVPRHTAHVLRTCLSDFLNGFEVKTIWALLESHSASAQEIGGILLHTIDASELELAEIASLASHEILAVREVAWKLCETQLERLRKDPGPLALVADSNWQDSRQFGFQFLGEHFGNEGALPPDVLIRICDSVRPDVQQFGRRLIERAFESGQGEQYVVKLSEHPSESMQLFASVFFEQNATENPERMAELEPFFVSVLSRVNRGRIAKTRVMDLLLREALRHQSAAQTTVRILTRVSATSAIQDRENIIAALLDIAERWPDMNSPLELKPVEIRGAV